jgi:uncharacterized membrane protein (UPF0127 family)
MQVVRITNTTKNTVVSERAELATGFFTRLRGLLGRKGLDDGCGLVLRPTDSIHTFFMTFPIDVVFLDKSGQVLKVIEAMKPGRVSPLVPHGKTVVELPVGTIARAAIMPGDRLSIPGIPTS